MLTDQTEGVALPREFVIYTDESDKAGRYFSNFYGGVLVRSTDLSAVIQRLESCRERLNLTGEVKWQKVTENYFSKYREFMGEFFDLVSADKVKVRVMFTQNRFVPVGLTPEQRREEYYRLYYQFLKHAFGLPWSTTAAHPVHVRVNLDQLPTNREETARFKSFVLRLNDNPRFRSAGIAFLRDQIAEVRSHDHCLLQGLDVVLGAICFRLNDKHREIPRGATRRGKRTIAKEKLYRFLLSRIQEMHPGFNIGISTGIEGEKSNRWNHRYRHWLFIPRSHEIDQSMKKPN